jgi:SpoVK/Ycf46/Vps4 family AAA+-type ATPase
MAHRGVARFVSTAVYTSSPCCLFIFSNPFVVPLDHVSQTQLARSIAGEARAAFYCIAPSDVLSKFVGESEAAVRSIFRRAMERARQLESKCAVVFFDEIDALGQSRSDRGGDSGGGEGEGCSRRILAELLIELNRIADQANDRMSAAANYTECDINGAQPDDDESYGSGAEDTRASDETNARVIVVAATNRIEDCDPALLRRFGVRVFVGPPSKRDRKKMLERHLSDIHHTLSPTDLNLLAAATDKVSNQNASVFYDERELTNSNACILSFIIKWSGSDIQSVAREAAMAPVRECIRTAVLRRKRAARREQQGASQETNPDLEARQSMIEGIQKLRPVSLDDFARGIDFFTTGQQEKSCTSAFDVHYDSSSDEDDYS